MRLKNVVYTRKGLLFLWIFWVITAIVGMSSVSMASDKLTIYVVNYPLQYFAERVAGEHATVVLPAPKDEDPAFWNPDVDTVAAYQQADVILLNGATYAKWVENVSLPQSKVMDTSKNFKDQYIITEGVVTHSHGPGGEHAHAGTAFTTWIDFDLAAKQAEAIANALNRKQPDLKETFQKNYVALEEDLMSLDQAIKAIVAKNQQQSFVASHPVYDYFARRYGLNIKSMLWESEEMPNATQWAELENMLKDHPAQWMIWEGEPLQESVDTLKSMGVNSLVFDPCGNVPADGDFLSMMRQNVENLKKAFP